MSFNSTSNDRIFLIDFLKSISILAVVSFHGLFIPESSYESAKAWIDIIFSPLRFCVPVFFTISFFLLWKSLKASLHKTSFNLIKQKLLRIALPIFFWFSIAIGLRYISNVPIGLPLLQGRVFPGAYYLIVMVTLIPPFILIGPQLTKPGMLPKFLVGQCAIFGVLWWGLKYAPSSIVIRGLEFVARPLPIYWLVYMAIGVFLYENDAFVLKLSKVIPKTIKILALTGTASLMMLEYSRLRYLVGEQPKPFEYAMFSCILSVFVLFICFANVEPKTLPGWFIAITRLLSKYSLGIFCINGIMSLFFLHLGMQLIQDVQVSFFNVVLLKLFGTLLLVALSLWLAQRLDRWGLKSCVR